MAKMTGPRRAEIYHLIPAAITAGKSFNAFIRELRATGPAPRRTDLLSEWRTQGHIEKKADTIKYVRKGYVPTSAIAEAKTWKLSREYMYKMQVATQLRPGEPIEKRFVNIMSDKPITIREAEERVAEIWAEDEKYRREEITGITPIAVIRKVA